MKQRQLSDWRSELYSRPPGCLLDSLAESVTYLLIKGAGKWLTVRNIWWIWCAFCLRHITTKWCIWYSVQYTGHCIQVMPETEPIVLQLKWRQIWKMQYMDSCILVTIPGLGDCMIICNQETAKEYRNTSATHTPGFIKTWNSCCGLVWHDCVTPSEL